MAKRELTVEIRGVDAGGKAVLTGFAAQAESVGRKMQSVGKKMSIGLTAPLVIAAKLAYDELASSEAAAAQTSAAIKSTGGVANVTATQVGNLADALSRKSGIDDEAIQSSENLLLTFKNVRNEVGQGNDIFNRATTAALDLSTAGFGALDSTSKMLGKALNDPIKGMTALGKAGVTFSDDQKQTIATMVRTGDVLGAQKLILAEVESQVGGSAAAYGETLPGQVGKAREALLNMAGAILMTAAPAFDVITSAAQDFAGFIQDLPTPIQGVIGAFAGIVAVAGPVVYVIGTLAQKWAAFSETALGQKTTAGLQGLGKNMAGLLPAAGVIGGIFAVGYGISQITGKSYDAAAAIKQLGRASDETLGKLASEHLANDMVSNQITMSESFRKIAETSTVTGQRIIDTWDAAGIPTKKYREILADVQRGNDQAGGSTDGLTGKIREQGYSATSTADQIRNLNNAVTEGVNAQLGVQGALLNVEAATNSYNEAVYQHGQTSLEARQAEQNLEGQYIATAQAIMANADSNRNGKVSTEEAKAATENQIATLSYLAAGLAPDSSLRVFLDQYINSLRTGIPQSVGTTITANAAGAFKVLRSVANAYMLVPGQAAAGYTLDAYLRAQGYAKGGNPKAGEIAWVGERGPELVQFGSDARVYSNADSRKMTTGDGGDLYVTLQFNQPVVGIDQMQDVVIGALSQASSRGKLTGLKLRGVTVE